MQPGDTINPGAEPPKEPEKPAADQKATPTAEQAITEVEKPSTEASQSAPESQWEFNTEDGKPSSFAPKSHEPVAWTASEYVAHEKSAGWYVLLMLIVVAIAVLVFLLTRESISTVVVVIMGIAFGVFASRQPQELEYRLDNTALHIGGRTYTYAQFKSFTVIDEGPIHSIMLLPLQRFMPPLSVYYAPEDETKITDALSSYLPYEDRKQDLVDKLMSKIRF